jgi:hypothetical protein
MVDKVKCGNKECKEFGKPVPVSLYFINKIAPLDGPWPCVVCGEPMKVALVIPDNYKGNGGKSMPKRITTSHPTSKTVGKKPVRRKSVKKITYLGVGKAAPSMFKKQKPKSAGRKQGPRKRG